MRFAAAFLIFSLLLSMILDTTLSDCWSDRDCSKPGQTCLDTNLPGGDTVDWRGGYCGILRSSNRGRKIFVPKSWEGFGPYL